MDDRIAIMRAKAPFVFFVVFFMSGAGIGLACTATEQLYDIVWWLFVLLGISFFLCALAVHGRKYPCFDVTGALFLSMLTCLGMLLVWQSHPRLDSHHFSRHHPTHLVGWISSEPHSKGKFLDAVMTVTQMKDGSFSTVHGKLLLRIDQEQDSIALNYGDKLLLKTTFTRISGPRNPYVFNYAQYMANHNIWHQAYLSSIACTKLAEHQGNPLVAYALSFRAYLVAKIKRYFQRQEVSNLLAALLLGYRTDLSDDLLQAFSATGTIHVLAVSGMHVGMIFTLLAFGLQWMKGRHLFLFRLLILLLAIWMYTLLTGFSASILRAAFMISFFLIATTLRRTHNAYNNMAASAFFLLLYDPKYLTDVGFQLSYLAVLGIVWLTPKLNLFSKAKSKWLRQLGNVLAVPCAAQLITFPLVIYYFHSFPVYFLPANLLLLIPTSLMMYVGFVLLALPVCTWTLTLASYLEQMVVISNKLLVAVAQWPYATIEHIWVRPVEMILLYVFLVAVFLAFQYRSKFLFYTALASVLLLGGVHGIKINRLHNIRQLIVFHIRHEVAIGLFWDKQAVLYSSAPVDQANIRYAVAPTLAAYATHKRSTFIPMPALAQSAHFQIHDRHIQFLDKQLWIVDGSMPLAPVSGQVDWLLIRNSPAITLSQLLRSSSCKPVLILDDSNSKATFMRYETEAKALGLSLYNLRDNFAYVSVIK